MTARRLTADALRGRTWHSCFNSTIDCRAASCASRRWAGAVDQIVLEGAVRVKLGRVELAEPEANRQRVPDCGVDVGDGDQVAIEGSVQLLDRRPASPSSSVKLPTPALGRRRGLSTWSG